MSLEFLTPVTVSAVQQYVGRFAPSPSGPLHFGSLVAAVGSYLQAKSQHGLWLLRIEDIDPPREMPGASAGILRTLAAHGLNWDGEVLFQSQQSERYECALTWLNEYNFSYYCDCTRKQIQQAGGHYTGTCRSKNLAPIGCSRRFRNTQPIYTFKDSLLGDVHIDHAFASEDFVIKRKDDLYAYHLAVVLDDIHQGVTEIVRGADLLSPTVCQLALYQAFTFDPPGYVHLPVAAEQPGKKLSKQNHAPALDSSHASANLTRVFDFLGLPTPKELYNAPVEELLCWAIANWQLDLLPKKREIIL